MGLYTIYDQTTGSVVENGITNNPITVELNIEQKDIKNVSKNGDNLTVELNSGEKITIKNYYAANAENNVIIKNAEGQYFELKVDQLVSDVVTTDINYSPIENIEGFLYKDPSIFSNLAVVGGSIAAGVAGVGAAVAGGSGGGSGSKSSKNDAKDRLESAIDDAKDALDGLTGSEKKDVEEAIKKAEDVLQKGSNSDAEKEIEELNKTVAEAKNSESQESEDESRFENLIDKVDDALELFKEENGEDSEFVGQKQVKTALCDAKDTLKSLALAEKVDPEAISKGYNDAYDKLYNAVNDILKEALADLLEQKIIDSELQLSNLTGSEKEALEQAIAKAKTKLDSNKFEDLLKANEVLNRILVEQLESESQETQNTKDLEAAIDDANKLLATLLDGSHQYQYLSKEINTAKDILSKGIETQLEEAAAHLNYVVENFELVLAKLDLESVLAEANEILDNLQLDPEQNATAIEILKENILLAQNALNSADANVENVNEALIDLSNIISGLDLAVAKKNLEDIIDKAKNELEDLDSNTSSKEYTFLNKAIEDAETVLNNTESKIVDIEDATGELQYITNNLLEAIEQYEALAALKNSIISANELIADGTLDADIAQFLQSKIDAAQIIVDSAFEQNKDYKEYADDFALLLQDVPKAYALDQLAEAIDVAEGKVSLLTDSKQITLANQAIADAKAALNNKDLSFEDLIDAKEKLNEIISDLNKAVAKKELEEEIDSAEALLAELIADPSSTSKQKEFLQKAIDEAKEALLDGLTQSDYSKADTKLSGIVADLDHAIALDDLKQAIESAKAKVLIDEYQKAILKQAVLEAEAVYVKANASTTDLANATKALNQKIDNLESLAAKAELEEAISAAETQASKLEEQDQKDFLNDAIAKAKEILDENSDSSALKNASDNLKEIIADIPKAISKQELEDLIDTAQELVDAPDQYGSVKDKLESAIEAVHALELKTKADYEQAITKLKAELADAEVLIAKEDLQKEILEAQAIQDLSSDEKIIMDQAIEKAQKVLEDVDSTKGDYIDAKNQLDAFVENFDQAFDKLFAQYQLQNIIDSAKAELEGISDEDAKQYLQNKIDEAQKVLNTTDSSVEALQDTSAELANILAVGVEKSYYFDELGSAIIDATKLIGTLTDADAKNVIQDAIDSADKILSNTSSTADQLKVELAALQQSLSSYQQIVELNKLSDAVKTFEGKWPNKLEELVNKANDLIKAGNSANIEEVKQTTDLFNRFNNSKNPEKTFAEYELEQVIKAAELKLETIDDAEISKGVSAAIKQAKDTLVESTTAAKLKAAATELQAYIDNPALAVAKDLLEAEIANGDTLIAKEANPILKAAFEKAVAEAKASLTLSVPSDIVAAANKLASYLSDPDLVLAKELLAQAIDNAVKLDKSSLNGAELKAVTDAIDEAKSINIDSYTAKQLDNARETLNNAIGKAQADQAEKDEALKKLIDSIEIAKTIENVEGLKEVIEKASAIAADKTKTKAEYENALAEFNSEVAKLLNPEDQETPTESTLLDDAQITFVDYQNIVGLVDSDAVGTTIELYENGSLIGSGVVDATGKFTINTIDALVKDTDVIFKAVDGKGNIIDELSLKVPTIKVEETQEETSVDIAPINILTAPIETTLKDVSKSNGSLLKVGVGGIIDLAALNLGDQFVLNLDGDKATTSYEDIEVKLTSYAVLNLTLGSTAYVYYREDETSEWTLVQTKTLGLVSLLGIPLVSDQVTINQPKPGQYTVIVGSTGIDANVIGAMKIQTIGGIVKIEDVPETIKGNVLLNDKINLDQNVKIKTISIVDAEGNVTTKQIDGSNEQSINGVYGTLTISSNGTYTYQLFDNDIKNVGKVDVFTYELDGGQTQTLNIRVENEDYPNIIWDDKNPSKDGVIIDLVSDSKVLNVEGALIEQAGKNLYTSEAKEVQVYVSLSKQYSVTSDVINKVGLSDYLEVTLSKTASNPRMSSVQILDDAGKAIDLTGLKITVDGVAQTVSGNSFVVTLKGEVKYVAQPISILIDGLPAGSYKVKTTAVENNTYTISQTVSVYEKVIDLNKTLLPKESGNLFANDLVDLNKVTWSVANKSSNEKADFTTNSSTTQVVKGLYGELSVSGNGQYTYTLKDQNGLGKTETFEYTTTDVNLNLTASNSLTIVIPNSSYTATEGTNNFEFNNDVVESVIFDVLNIAGNTTDTINNFEIGTVNNQGDVIDISELLVGFDATTDDLNKFVNINFDSSKNTATISIDRDGEAKAFDSEELVKLVNIQKLSNHSETIKTGDDLLKLLIDNNQLIY